MKKTKLSIHCMLSNIESHDNPETLHKWHVGERGWSYTGYHALISKDGTIHTHKTNKLMRPLKRDAAAVKGHNDGMIAICLWGIDENDFTREQYKALTRQAQHYLHRFDGIERGEIKGHNEYSGHKDRGCPNFDIRKILWSGALL